MNLKYLFAFSLAGNAALLAVLVFKAPAPAHSDPSRSTETRAPNAAKDSPPESAQEAMNAVKSAESAAAKLAPELWARIYSSDLPTLVANLRALGVSPRLVRAIVRTELEAANFERRAAIMKERAAAPYWNSKLGSQYGYSVKLSQLAREERDAASALLGADAYPTGEELKWSSPLPNLELSGEKIQAFQRIKSDYDEIRNQVYVSANGILLPEAREKLRLVESEYRNDLAALLSPEELREYELRSSQTANQLRSQYSSFDFTEAEFQSVFAAQAVFDRKYSSFAFVENSANPERIADQKKLDEGFKAALGEERFKELQRSKDYGYRIVSQVASEYSLPKTTAGAVFDLETESKARFQKVVGDRSMNMDQKEAALARLSEDYSAKLGQLLPGKATDSYLAMSGSSLKRMIDSTQRNRKQSNRDAAPTR